VSNQPANPVAQFNLALKRKDPDEAWRWAHRMRPLSLSQALSLTVLLGLAGDARYRPAAERFKERYRDEANPTPQQEEKVVDDLDKLVRVCPPVLKYTAGEDLRALAEQLAALPAPVDVPG
jgi:hypothetical protein